MKTVLYITLCVFLVFPLSIFAQQRTNDNSNADFSADVTSTCGSFLVVHFTDESVIPEGDFITRWTWTFGDGGMSNDWQPAYQYTRPGKYTVRLIIETNLGGKDTIEKIDYISIEGDAFVNLGNDTAINEGESLILDAGNPGAKYNWNDGSNTQTIIVTQAGEYWVHVKKGECESRDRINVRIIPKTDPHTSFIADTTSTCGSFLTVHFKDETVLEKDDFISRWTWTFGDGAMSNDWQPTHVYTKPGLYTVRLVIETAHGFTYASERRGYIYIGGDAFVNLGSDTAICEGTTMQLDAGNPGAVYSWNTGENTQKIMVTEPGEYWVHIKNGVCESRDIIRIGTRPPVFPNFGFTLHGNCLPVNASFSDSSSWCGNNNIVRRLWDFGDGNTSSVQHPQHNYTSADTFIVRLTIWDMNGFSITRSKRVVITATQQGPTVNLGKDTAVCFGETLTLNAGNAGSNYLWSTGETSPEITVQDDGAYWVTVTNGSCVSIDTINVQTIFPATPGFDYTMQGNCLPVDVQFKDMSSVRCGQQIVQWRWDFGDGTISQQQHPLHTYNRSDTFAIRLTVTTDRGMSISKSKKIFVENIAPVVNAGNDITICKGDSVQLDAGVDNATYLWTPETSLDNKAIRRPMASPLETTTYLVAVTKCSTTVSDQVVVMVNTPSQPSLNPDGKLLVSSRANGYQWYRNNQMIPGATRRNYEPATPGFYSVKTSNAAGCQATSNSFSYVPTTKKEKWTNGIKVTCTPNPSAGVVYVHLSYLPGKPIGLSVIDKYGQPLVKTTINNYTNMLNLSNLAKGYYSVELILGKEKVSIPVLIQ